MKKFFKRFKEWFVIKPRLDSQDHNPPLVKERDVWWIYMGENVGTEVSGKGDKFSRPVIILKKLSKYTYLIVPTSTKMKEGSWFVKFIYNDRSMVACLHQIKVIDYRRLDNKVGALSRHDFQMVQNGFEELYIQQ